MADDELDALIGSANTAEDPNSSGFDPRVWKPSALPSRNKPNPVIADGC